MIKDCSEFDTGKHDVFVRIEQRLRCDKAQEERNNLGKQCHKKDADAGKATMYVRRCYGAGWRTILRQYFPPRVGRWRLQKKMNQ